MRVGEDGLAPQAGLFVAQAKGHFWEEGLAVEFVPFTNEAQMIPALVAGDLDVVGGSTNALRRGGLTLSDVTVAAVDSFPALNRALADGEIDGGMQVEPYVTQGRLVGVLEVFRDPCESAPCLSAGRAFWRNGANRLGWA